MTRLALIVPAAALALLGACPAIAAPPAETKTTLALGIQLEPPSLDPTSGPAEAIRDVTYGNIFEGLTRIDARGEVQPLLATAWSVSPNGLRYDFALRPNVRFSDGSAFDCGTVRFSYDRARAKDGSNAQKAFFAPIAAIDCPKPDEAVVTLSAPDSDFLYHMAWADAVMVSPASAAGNAQHPVGTGPFVFADWRRGDSITLRRNDAYWGDKPQLTEATFRFITDPLAAATALQGGTLDAYSNFPSTELLSRFRNDPNFVVAVGKSPIKLIWALNERRKPFADLRVRQALAMAIDRKSIAQAGYDGLASVIGTHDTPSDADYLDLSGRYPYDPQKAKDLLRAAGVAPGTRFSIALPPTDYARKTGTLIAAYLQQVGLDATLAPMQWPQWLAQVYGQAQFDTTVIAHTEPHDLEIYARPGYYFGFHDDAYDALWHRYQAARAPAERRALSQQMQTRLADLEPNIFLATVPHISIWNAKLQGLWSDEPIPANPLAQVHWGP